MKAMRVIMIPLLAVLFVSCPNPFNASTSGNKVLYSGNGNTTGTPPSDSNSYADGVSVVVMGNPGNLSKSGYSFGGWNTASSGSGTEYSPGDTFKMGSAAVTLYAKWTPIPSHLVKYDGNGNTSGSVPIGPSYYQEGTTVTAASNTGNLAKTGNTFVGWNTAPDGSGTDYSGGTTFIMGTSDVTLYAHWTVNPTYTVTYDGNGSTGGSVPTDGNAYEQGMSVLVRGNTGSLTRSGYTFGGWNTSSTGTGTSYAQSDTFVMGNTNVTLYAQWVLIPTYTVTYNPNGATSGSVPTDSNNYQQGASVTVLANSGALTRSGYTFNGWNAKADGTGTEYGPGSTFVMGSVNVTLYADFLALGALKWSGYNLGMGSFSFHTMVLDPGDRYLYLTIPQENAVHVYSFDSSTGALAETSGSPFTTGSYPVGVTVDPTDKFAYVTNYQDNTVSAYTINSTTGALTEISGSPYATGTSPQAVIADPTGKFLYVLNNSSSNVSAFTINSTTGALAEISGSPFACGSMPMNATTDPTGSFLYVANWGPSDISAYKINTSSGALAQVTGSPFTVGTNPIDVAFGPSASPYLYVLNDTSGNVSAFTINSTTGVPSTISGSPFTVGSDPRAVVVDPTGKYLYVPNLGDYTVTEDKITAGSGSLTSIDGSPLSAYDVMGAITDHSGKYVLLNYGGSTVSVFSINQ